MLCAFLLLVAAFTAAEGAVAGCSPIYTTGFGFNAKFYTYDLFGEAGWEPDFFTSGYRTTLTKTVRAVAGANYQTWFSPPGAEDHNYIYGYYTTSTNFAVELSGFFRAPFSGKYTFHLDANAGASFQLGTSGTCCNDAACSDLADLAINTLGTTDADTKSVSYKLLGGGFYPVKIVSFNSRGNAGLRVAVTDPFGLALPDMGLHVLQANFRNSQCKPSTTGVTTVTSQWKKTYTSTTTRTGKGTNTVVVVMPKPKTTVTTLRSDSKTKSTTICGKSTDTVVVGVPTPATTLTAAWTGSVTSTTTISGSTKTVVVEVPKSHVTVTNTWGNSFVQTTTVAGSFTDTVIVDVPTPTATLTSVWTESFTSSRTAVGGPGESNTVIVEVPKKTETTTRAWTELYASVSTISGSLTDTVVVDVPTPLVTLTSAWSNTYVSTKTISGSTKTIVVEVPKATTTISSTWTGASTVSSTIPGALTDTVIVNVPTPTTTVTSPWSQTHTSTTTALGATNTVIEEVPKVTVTSTITWSNSGSRTSTVSGEFTDTIVVNVPKPTTTIISAWSETYTSTSTQTGATDTVVVEVPKKSVTLTSTWTDSFSSTSTFAGSLTDTIIVNVPKPTTTFTSAWLNTYTSTTTAVGPTNTVIVEVPKAITTVTRTWSDSHTTSSTATGALTDTVIVDVPKPITTVTSAWTQSFASTTTMTGVTNTIVVEVPKATATVTNTWANSFVSSSTNPGALTDTVVVEVPTPTQTVTSVWTGSYVTSTTVTGGPGENNTVIVEIPHSLTTVTRTWTGTRTTTYILSGSVTDTIVVNDPFVQSMSSSLSDSSRRVSFLVSGSSLSSNTRLLSRVSRTTSLGQESSATSGMSQTPGTYTSGDVPQMPITRSESLTASTSLVVRSNIESSVVGSESMSGLYSLPNSGVFTESVLPSSELDASSTKSLIIGSSALIDPSPTASSRFWSTDAPTYLSSQRSIDSSSSFGVSSSPTKLMPSVPILSSVTSSQTRAESSVPAASSSYESSGRTPVSIIPSMVASKLVSSGDSTEEKSASANTASSGRSTFSLSGGTEYSHDFSSLPGTVGTSASPISPVFSAALATSDAISTSISLDGSSTGSWKFSADISSSSRVDSSSAAGSWAMNPSETRVPSTILGGTSSASVLSSSVKYSQTWARSSDFEKSRESNPTSMLIVSSGESHTSVDFSTSPQMGSDSSASATVSTVSNSSSSSCKSASESWEQAFPSTEAWSSECVSSELASSNSFVSSGLVEPTRVAVSSANLGFTSGISRASVSSQSLSITGYPSRSNSEILSSEIVVSSSIAGASSDMSSCFSTTESTGFNSQTESDMKTGFSFESVYTSSTEPVWASSLSSWRSDVSFSNQEPSIKSSRLDGFESRGASTSLEATPHFSNSVTPSSTTDSSFPGLSTTSWSSMSSVSENMVSTLTDTSSVTEPEGGSIGLSSNEASASISVQSSEQRSISSFVDSVSWSSTGSPTESGLSFTYESTERSSSVPNSGKPSSFEHGHASESSTSVWSDSTSIFEPTKAVPSSVSPVLPSNCPSSSAFVSRYWNMSAQSSDFGSSQAENSIASETDFTSVHSSYQAESSRTFGVSHSSASSRFSTTLTDLYSSTVTTVAAPSDVSESNASSSALSGVSVSSAVSEPSATSSLLSIESSGFSGASEPGIEPTSSSSLEDASSFVILSSSEPSSSAHSESGTASNSASPFEYSDSKVTESMTVSESSEHAFSDRQTSSTDMLSGSEFASRTLSGDASSSRLGSWMISVSGTTVESIPGTTLPPTFESWSYSEVMSTTIGASSSSSNPFGDLYSTSAEMSRLVSEPSPGSSSTLQESVSTGASFVESQSASSIYSGGRTDTVSFTSLEPWHVSSTATETGFTSGNFESDNVSHSSTTMSESELSEVSTSTHDYPLESSSSGESWSQTVSTSADSVSVGVTSFSKGHEVSSTSTFSTSIAAPAISSGSSTTSVFSALEGEPSSFEEAYSRVSSWSSSLAASATEEASLHSGNAGLSVSGTVSERASLAASSDFSKSSSLSSSVFSGWNASYETTTMATLSESRPSSLSGDFTSTGSDALWSGSGNTAISGIQTTTNWPSRDESTHFTPSRDEPNSLLSTAAHSTSDATLSISSSEHVGSEPSTTTALPSSRALSDYGDEFRRGEASSSEKSSSYMKSPTSSAPDERTVLSSSQRSSVHLSEEGSHSSTVASGGFGSAVLSSMTAMSPTSAFESLATSGDNSKASDWLSSGILSSSGSVSQSSFEMSSAISVSNTWPVMSATSSDWLISLTSGLDDAASRSLSVSSSFAESISTSGTSFSESDSVLTTSDSLKVASGSSIISPSSGLSSASGSHSEFSVSTDEASQSYQPSIESEVFSNTDLNRGSFTLTVTGSFPSHSPQVISSVSASSAEATLGEISWRSDAETGSSWDPTSSDAHALSSTSTTGPVTSSSEDFISSSMWSNSFVSSSGAHDAESMFSSNSGASSREAEPASKTVTFVGSSSVGSPLQSADATSSSEPTSYLASSIGSEPSTNSEFVTYNTAVSLDVTHSTGTSSALARSSSSQASEGLEPQSSLASENVSSWESHVSGSSAVSASASRLASAGDSLAESTSVSGDLRVPGSTDFDVSPTSSSVTDLEPLSDSASLGVSSSTGEMTSSARTNSAPESSHSSVTSFEVGKMSTSVFWATSTSGNCGASSFGGFSSPSRYVTIVDSASSAKWGSTTQVNSPSRKTSTTSSSLASLDVSSEASSIEFTSALSYEYATFSQDSWALSTSASLESVTVSSLGPETSSEALTKSASHVRDGASISSRLSAESSETEWTRTSSQYSSVTAVVSESDTVVVSSVMPGSISSLFSLVSSRIGSESSTLDASSSSSSSVPSFESESSKELPASLSDYFSSGHSTVEPGSHSLAASFIVPSSTRSGAYVASRTETVGSGTSFLGTDSSVYSTSELSSRSSRMSSADSNSGSHASSETKESSLSSLGVAASLSSSTGSSSGTRLASSGSSATSNVDSFVSSSSIESAYSISEHSANSAISLSSGSSNTRLNRESSSSSDASRSFTSVSENASSASSESSGEILPSVTNTNADTSFTASAERPSGTRCRSATDSDAIPETFSMSSQKLISETHVSQGFHTDPSSVLFSESSATFKPSIDSISSSESRRVAGSGSLVETGSISMTKPTSSTNAASTSIDATFDKHWPSSSDVLGSSVSVSLTDATSPADGSSSSELLPQSGVTSQSEMLLISTSFDTISSTTQTWSSGSATVLPTSSSKTVNSLNSSSDSSGVISSIFDSVSSSVSASHVTTVVGSSSFATSDSENASDTFSSAVSSFGTESITRSVSRAPVLASGVISWSSSLASRISSKRESDSSNLAEQSTASNSEPLSGSNLGSSVLFVSETEHLTATLSETNTWYTSIAASFIEGGSSSILGPSKSQSKSGNSESTVQARSSVLSTTDSFSSAQLSMVGSSTVASDPSSDAPVSAVESSYVSESDIVSEPSSAPGTFSSLSAASESRISSIALSSSTGFSESGSPLVSSTPGLVSSSVSTLYTGSTLISASQGTVSLSAESDSEATSVTKASAVGPVSSSLAASLLEPHSNVVTESSVSTTVAEKENTSDDLVSSTSQAQGETVSSVATMTDSRSEYAGSSVETGSTAVSTNDVDDISSSFAISEIRSETSRISASSQVSPSSDFSSRAVVSSPVTFSKDLPSSRLVSASESRDSRTGIPTYTSASGRSAALSSRNAMGKSGSSNITSADSSDSGGSGSSSSATNDVSISHGFSFPTSLAASFVTETTKFGSGSLSMAVPTTVSVSTGISDNGNDSVLATVSTGSQLSTFGTYSRSVVSGKSKLETSISAETTAATSKLPSSSSAWVTNSEGEITSITASFVVPGSSMISSHASESNGGIISSSVGSDSTLSSEQNVPFLTSVAGTFTIPSPAESRLAPKTGEGSSAASILSNSVNTSVKTSINTSSEVASETNSERQGSSRTPGAHVSTTFALSQGSDANQSSAKSSSQSSNGVSKTLTSSMAADVTKSAPASWDTGSGLTRTTSAGRAPVSLTSVVSDDQQPPFPTSLAASFEAPSMSSMVNVKSDPWRAVPSQSMKSDAADGTMPLRSSSRLSVSGSSGVSGAETSTSLSGIPGSSETEPTGTGSAASDVVNESASATMVYSQWVAVSSPSTTEGNSGATSSTMAAGSWVDTGSSIKPGFSSKLETRSSSSHATAPLSQPFSSVSLQSAEFVPHSSVVSSATSSPIFESMETSHTIPSGTVAFSSSSQSGSSASFVIGVSTESASQTSGASDADESADTRSGTSPVLSIVTRLTSLRSSEMTPGAEAASSSHASSSVFCYRGKCVTKSGEQPQSEIAYESEITKVTSSVSWTSSTSVGSASSANYASQASEPIPVGQSGGNAPKVGIPSLALIIPILLIFV